MEPYWEWRKEVKVRSDKKFGVKVWVQSVNKDLFRSHCLRYHLSMMFVAEKYIEACLKDLSDYELENIIDSRINVFNQMKSSRIDFEPIGLKVTNDYWQKLGYFAIKYKTSIVKISSCIFDYSLTAYELRGMEEEYGLTFDNKKKNKKVNRDYLDLHERLSDN